MTGPEHYRRAEELLGGRRNAGSNGAKTLEEAIALAQVHATLALTAATAEPIAQSLGTESEEIATAWSEAIS